MILKDSKVFKCKDHELSYDSRKKHLISLATDPVLMNISPIQIGATPINLMSGNISSEGVTLTDFKINDVKDYKESITLRSTAANVQRSGAADKILTLSVTFTGVNSINHELRHILAQMMVSPIIPIRCADITRLMMPYANYQTIYEVLERVGDLRSFITANKQTDRLETFYRVFAPLYAVESYRLAALPDRPNSITLIITARLIDHFALSSDGVPRYLMHDVYLFFQMANSFSGRTFANESITQHASNSHMIDGLWKSMMGGHLGSLQVQLRSVGDIISPAMIDKIGRCMYNRSVTAGITGNIALSGPFRRYYKMLLQPINTTNKKIIDNSTLDNFEYLNNSDPNLRKDVPYQNAASNSIVNRVGWYNEDSGTLSMSFYYKSYSKLGTTYFDTSAKEVQRLISYVVSLRLNSISVDLTDKFNRFIAFLMQNEADNPARFYKLISSMISDIRTTLLSDNSRLRKELNTLRNKDLVSGKATDILSILDSHKDSLSKRLDAFEAALLSDKATNVTIATFAKTIRNAHNSSTIGNSINNWSRGTKVYKFRISKDTGIVESMYTDDKRASYSEYSLESSIQSGVDVFNLVINNSTARLTSTRESIQTVFNTVYQNVYTDVVLPFVAELSSVLGMISGRMPDSSPTSSGHYEILTLASDSLTTIVDYSVTNNNTVIPIHMKGHSDPYIQCVGGNRGSLQLTIRTKDLVLLQQIMVMGFELNIMERINIALHFADMHNSSSGATETLSSIISDRIKQYINPRKRDIDISKPIFIDCEVANMAAMYEIVLTRADISTVAGTEGLYEVLLTFVKTSQRDLTLSQPIYIADDKVGSKIDDIGLLSVLFASSPWLGFEGMTSGLVTVSTVYEDKPCDWGAQFASLDKNIVRSHTAALKFYSNVVSLLKYQSAKITNIIPSSSFDLSQSLTTAFTFIDTLGVSLSPLSDFFIPTFVKYYAGDITLKDFCSRCDELFEIWRGLQATNINNTTFSVLQNNGSTVPTTHAVMSACPEINRTFVGGYVEPFLLENVQAVLSLVKSSPLYRILAFASLLKYYISPLENELNAKGVGEMSKRTYLDAMFNSRKVFTRDKYSLSIIYNLGLLSLIMAFLPSTRYYGEMDRGGGVTKANDNKQQFIDILNRIRIGKDKTFISSLRGLDPDMYTLCYGGGYVKNRSADKIDMYVKAGTLANKNVFIDHLVYGADGSQLGYLHSLTYTILATLYELDSASGDSERSNLIVRHPGGKTTRPLGFMDDPKYGVTACLRRLSFGIGFSGDVSDSNSTIFTKLYAPITGNSPAFYNTNITYKSSGKLVVSEYNLTTAEQTANRIISFTDAQDLCSTLPTFCHLYKYEDNKQTIDYTSVSTKDKTKRLIDDLSTTKDAKSILFKCYIPNIPLFRELYGVCGLNYHLVTLFPHKLFPIWKQLVDHANATSRGRSSARTVLKSISYYTSVLGSMLACVTFGASTMVAGGIAVVTGVASTILGLGLNLKLGNMGGAMMRRSFYALNSVLYVPGVAGTGNSFTASIVDMISTVTRFFNSVISTRTSYMDVLYGCSPATFDYLKFSVLRLSSEPLLITVDNVMKLFVPPGGAKVVFAPENAERSSVQQIHYDTTYLNAITSDIYSRTAEASGQALITRKLVSSFPDYPLPAMDSELKYLVEDILRMKENDVDDPPTDTSPLMDDVLLFQNQLESMIMSVVGTAAWKKMCSKDGIPNIRRNMLLAVLQNVGMYTSPVFYMVTDTYMMNETMSLLKNKLNETNQMKANLSGVEVNTKESRNNIRSMMYSSVQKEHDYIGKQIDDLLASTAVDANTISSDELLQRYTELVHSRNTGKLSKKDRERFGSGPGSTWWYLMTKDGLKSDEVQKYSSMDRQRAMNMENRLVELLHSQSTAKHMMTKNNTTHGRGLPESDLVNSLNLSLRHVTSNLTFPVLEAKVMHHMKYAFSDVAAAGGLRMFPTFAFYILERDRGLWTLYYDKYIYQAVESIRTFTSRKMATTTAVVVLNNQYGSLSSIQSEEYNRETFSFIKSPNLPLNALRLRTGAQIQIRAGYSAVLTEDDIIFSGKVASIDGSDIMTLTCQSDGAVLTQVIFPNGKKFGGVGAFFTNTVSSAVKAATSSRALEDGVLFTSTVAVENLLGLLMDEVDGTEVLGQEHEILANYFIPGSTTAGRSWAGRAVEELKQNAIQTFIGMGNAQHVDTRFINVFIDPPSRKLSYSGEWLVYNETLWDAINDVVMTTGANHICTVRPFGNRSSLVIGDVDGDYYMSSPANSAYYKEYFYLIYMLRRYLKNDSDMIGYFGSCLGRCVKNAYAYFGSNGKDADALSKLQFELPIVYIFLKYMLMYTSMLNTDDNADKTYIEGMEQAKYWSEKDTLGAIDPNKVETLTILNGLDSIVKTIKSISNTVEHRTDVCLRLFNAVYLYSSLYHNSIANDMSDLGEIIDKSSGTISGTDPFGKALGWLIDNAFTSLSAATKNSSKLIWAKRIRENAKLRDLRIRYIQELVKGDVKESTIEKIVEEICGQDSIKGNNVSKDDFLRNKSNIPSPTELQDVSNGGLTQLLHIVTHFRSKMTTFIENSVAFSIKSTFRILLDICYWQIPNFRPISVTHYIDSTNIIYDGIKVVDGPNKVIMSYLDVTFYGRMFGALPIVGSLFNALDVDTLVSKPSQRMTTEVLLDDNIFPYAIRSYTTFFKNAMSRDTRIWDYSSVDAIAFKILCNLMRDHYDGSIILLGKQNIQPYDSVVISDPVTMTYGTFDVKDVTHEINAEVGYVTTISPDLHIRMNFDLRFLQAPVYMTIMKWGFIVFDVVTAVVSMGTLSTVFASVGKPLAKATLTPMIESGAKSLGTKIGSDVLTKTLSTTSTKALKSRLMSTIDGVIDVNKVGSTTAKKLKSVIDVLPDEELKTLQTMLRKKYGKQSGKVLAELTDDAAAAFNKDVAEYISQKCLQDPFYGDDIASAISESIFKIRKPSEWISKSATNITGPYFNKLVAPGAKYLRLGAKAAYTTIFMTQADAVMSAASNLVLQIGRMVGGKRAVSMTALVRNDEPMISTMDGINKDIGGWDVFRNKLYLLRERIVDMWYETWSQFNLLRESIDNVTTGSMPGSKYDSIVESGTFDFSVPSATSGMYINSSASINSLRIVSEVVFSSGRNTLSGCTISSTPLNLVGVNASLIDLPVINNISKFMITIPNIGTVPIKLPCIDVQMSLVELTNILTSLGSGSQVIKDALQSFAPGRSGIKIHIRDSGDILTNKKVANAFLVADLEDSNGNRLSEVIMRYLPFALSGDNSPAALVNYARTKKIEAMDRIAVDGNMRSTEQYTFVVDDGDTMYFLDGTGLQSVRLLGIDAPETLHDGISFSTNQKYYFAHPWGYIAAEYAKKILSDHGNQGYLDFRTSKSSTYKYEVYGRVLASVCGNDWDMASELIKVGGTRIRHDELRPFIDDTNRANYYSSIQTLVSDAFGATINDAKGMWYIQQERNQGGAFDGDYNQLFNNSGVDTSKTGPYIDRGKWFISEYSVGSVNAFNEYNSKAIKSFRTQILFKDIRNKSGQSNMLAF